MFSTLQQTQLPKALFNRYNATVSAKGSSELINQGREVLPAVQTVQSRYNGHTKVYANPDQALQESKQNARVMENDLLIRECVESRFRAVSLQDRDVEALDIAQFTAEDRDEFEEMNQMPWKKVNKNHWNAEELAKKMRLIKEIEYQPTQRLYALMNAVWFGRYGVENQFSSRYVDGIGTVKNVITKWKPKHGDKYIFRFDDGSHDVEEGQVGIRVSSLTLDGTQRFFTDIHGKKHQKIIPTQYGLAYLLDPIERDATTLHKHIVEDGIYEDPRSTGSLYGVGIRSRIYWAWFQMQEALKIMLNYLERTGLGIEIWKYPANNPVAEAETKRMMEERGSSGYSAFLVPVQAGEDAGLYEPHIMEPGPGGIGEMNEIITTRYHDQIKRYILGQKLTTEADATGLGGNLADVHLATFGDIVKFDSVNLEDTETQTLRVQQSKNFPGSEGVFLNFKLKSRQAEMDKTMAAIEKAHNLGFRVDPSIVGDTIGIAEAEEGQGLIDRQGGGMGMQPGGPPPMMQPPSDLSPQNQSTFPPSVMQAGEDSHEATRYNSPIQQVSDLLGASKIAVRQ